MDVEFLLPSMIAAVFMSGEGLSCGICGILVTLVCFQAVLQAHDVIIHEVYEGSGRDPANQAAGSPEMLHQPQPHTSSQVKFDPEVSYYLVITDVFFIEMFTPYINCQ